MTQRRYTPVLPADATLFSSAPCPSDATPISSVAAKAHKPGEKKSTSLDAASREDLVIFVKKQARKMKGLEASVAGTS